MARLRQQSTYRARALRQRATPAEQLLWQALRGRKIRKAKFRRQQPLGPYIADFACLKARLLIELDGGHHSQDRVAEKDAQRTLWLEKEGYRVIRFWNSELTDNLNGVLDTIYAALYGSLQTEALALPTPPRPNGRPSPSRGG